MQRRLSGGYPENGNAPSYKLRGHELLVLNVVYKRLEHNLAILC